MQSYYFDIIEDKRKGFSAELIKGILWGGSCGYRLSSWGLRRAALAIQKKLPRPVVSVGNVTWGGTGKTTLVAWLIEHMQARQRRAAVLMHGYGNDEHQLLEHTFPGVPILCGKNRYATAMSFVRDNEVDVFILDDGFQQWGLARDFDCVTINCLCPWGNGHLIPRGMLREPLSSLSRAHAVVLTNANMVSGATKDGIKNTVAAHVPPERILEAIHQPSFCYRAVLMNETLSLECLRGRKAVIFAGIGSPQSFKSTVESLGVVVKQSIEFADHHHYTHRDMHTIREYLRADPALIAITTEKDFMRNRNLIGQLINPYILSVRMELRDTYGTFITGLDRLLGG